MAKARSGVGSVKKRLSGKLKGKYRAQWAYSDPVTGQFASVDRTFPTEREASELLADLQAHVRTGQAVAAARSKRALTLNDWFDELAGTRESGFDGRWNEDGALALTTATKATRYNRHVRHTVLGPMPIRAITVDHVRRFYRELKETGRSEATVHDVKAVLVKVVNDAIDTYEKLPNLRNVFAKVKVSEPTQSETVALSVEAAKAGMANLTSEEDRALLGVFLLAGLRLSEAMALTAGQVDFGRSVIVVDRAVKLDGKGAQTLGLPKCAKSRYAVMCPTLADLLRPLTDSGKTYLFPAGSADKPRTKKVFYARWRGLVAEAKLPAGTTPKACRLAHNNWIEKLMPKVSLSTRLEHMGHSLSRGGSAPQGVLVNIRNYTKELAASQAILRKELERVVGVAAAKGRAEARRDIP